MADQYVVGVNGSRRVTSNSEEITAESLIHQIIERYPQTVEVFVQHRLQCAGCCISPFHTIADSARECAVSIEPLLRDLNQALPAGTS